MFLPRKAQKYKGRPDKVMIMPTKDRPGLEMAICTAIHMYAVINSIGTIGYPVVLYGRSTAGILSLRMIWARPEPMDESSITKTTELRRFSKVSTRIKIPARKVWQRRAT